MKILVFAEVYFPDIIGGGEISTKLMTEGMVSLGHNVSVYCLGKKTQTENINGVIVNRVYKNELSEYFLSVIKDSQAANSFTIIKKIMRKTADIYENRKWYKYYRDIIRIEQPNVVHSVAAMSFLGRINLWKAAFDEGIPMSHICRSPNLLELQFFNGRFNNYYVHRNAIASKYLTALTAPSQYMLDCHLKKHIQGRRFNEVIYNAVDFSTVIPNDNIVSNKKNLVLYAGDIRKEKGIITLINAIRMLPDVELLLVGKGDLFSKIKEDNQIKLLSWVDKDVLYGYMKKAKAVVLPSEWNEAFGRILIEGINNCTIGIGSDMGGIPEVLDFNSDYIFESGNVEDLKNKISSVVRYTTEKYIDEIKKQQEHVKKFSISAYKKNWEKFFLQQIEGGLEGISE